MKSLSFILILIAWFFMVMGLFKHNIHICVIAVVLGFVSVLMHANSYEE